MKRSILAVVMAGTMALSLAACGGSAATATTAAKAAAATTAAKAAATTAAPAATTTAAATTKAAAAAATTAAGSGKDAKKAKYAFVIKTLSSDFWQNMKTGIEAHAKELGVTVDVYAGNTEDDVEGQVQLLENAISQKYDAIGVAPISDVNLNNKIAEATKAGIKVVNVDEKIDTDVLGKLGGAVCGFVATDNTKVGKSGAEYLLKQIGGSGEVAIVEGKAGALSGEQRRDGAKAAFEAAGAKIVDSQPADWDRTKAYDVATNYIQAHPDLKAIYCCNDTMAMGVQEAVEKSGKDIKVCGTDGNADAIKSVADGKLSGTVMQDSATIGAKALDLMVDAIKNDAPMKAGQKVEQTGVDSILITKDNASKYVK